jgi:Flagellar biosynthesis protein, FliO
MSQTIGRQQTATTTPPGGIAGRILRRLMRGQAQEPRLALLERIALAPRHSLALVEADGRRLLVATSAESGPVFYALDAGGSSRADRPGRRISW